jgi:hypothetical protein
VQIDTNKVYIGGRIALSFRIPARCEVINPKEIKTDTLELLSISNNIIEEKGKKFAQFRAIFTSFMEGTHYIPQLIITDLDTSTGKETKYITDSIAFSVINFPVDTTKIETKDIKPIIKESFNIREILPIIWITLAVLAVIIGLFLLIRYFKKGHKPNIRQYIAPIKSEPADVKALKALDYLRQKHLPEQGQKKQYYSEMTDILRNFLMEAFGIYALEMTSSEIIFTLQQQISQINGEENLARLRYILSYADLVKFAKFNTDTNIDEKSIEMSRTFIVKASEINNDLKDRKEETENV